MRASGVERFAYPVNSLADLDRVMDAALAARLEPEESIRKIVVAPRQSHLGQLRGWRRWLSALLPWEWTPEWVLVLTTRGLLVAIVPRPGEPPTVVSIPTARLLWIEIGEILLYGWFECAWAGQGKVQHQRVYFNTVGDELFHSIRVALCRDVIAGTGLASKAGRRDLDPLRPLPFKFMNIIGHHLLLPDETVEAVVYRPAIWEKRLGLFSHQRAPAVALVLSNYHLLIAEEDRSDSEVSYGLSARFCPRARLRRFDIVEKEDERELWLQVTVGLDEAEETWALLFPTRFGPALLDLAALLL